MKTKITYRDLRVVGSFITITSVISPNLLKYSRRPSTRVMKIIYKKRKKKWIKNLIINKNGWTFFEWRKKLQVFNEKKKQKIVRWSCGGFHSFFFTKKITFIRSIHLQLINKIMKKTRTRIYEKYENFQFSICVFYSCLCLYLCVCVCVFDGIF